MSKFEELHSWVKELPIIDWHNHLDMAMLAEDKPLGSLYEVWVKSDPYKHRAMRICGEPEELITGTGTTGILPVGRERNPSQFNGQDARCPGEETAKWAAWMRTLPKLVGNPLFTWAKMELEWLGLDPLPYLHGTGENISLSNWTPSKILKRFNVEYLSPCVTGTTGILPVALGQRASCPLEGKALGQRTSCPLKIPPLGQRASCPLQWTAAAVKEFPTAQSAVSSHFSHTLASGSFHKRNLPHVGQQSSLVFVTFRLGDSLPQSSLDELEEYRREWLLSHPEPWSEEVCQEWKAQLFGKIDKWLDAGHGSCMLADPRLRKVVEDALEFFNATGTTGILPVGECSTGTTGILPVENRKGRSYSINRQDASCSSGRSRYRLHAYIVMPNHVHVLFELFDAKDLSAIIHSWKSFTAKKLNEITGGRGKIWKEEYYDRLIRNADHYVNTLAYIRKNGAAAKALANANGQDARCPSAAVPNGQDARCPSAAVPNGQDARCPSIVPSFRMNVDDEVSVERLEKFHEAGCRIVDVSVDDAAQLTTLNSQLSTVAAYAAAHGWTMLLHLGALRETSKRLRAAAGPVGGFAGMRAPVDPAAVAAFLSKLECSPNLFSRKEHKEVLSTNEDSTRSACSTRLNNPQNDLCASASLREKNTSLPRTILMSLNPEAHAQLAVLAGSFVEEGMPGKVQLGPAWWWCDHEEGIRDVLEKNAAYGVLSTFIGMTTDSRSLLSFVRHDCFRRILCKWVAEKVAAGAFPDDEALLRPMLENICYKNAKTMIGGKP